MSDQPAEIDSTTASGGGMLRVRPVEGVTFRGRTPEQAAAHTLSRQTPTRCPARTRLYRAGTLEAEGFPVADISDHLADPDATVWLDLHDPDSADLEVLVEEFGFHPLAIEDAVHEHQRPKLDRYRTNAFLSVYALRYDSAEQAMHASELAVFLMHGAMITVRKDDGFDPQALLDRWDAEADLARHGVGFLLHGLLDLVVDGHFAALGSLDEGADALEDELFVDGGTAANREFDQRSFTLRKNLVLTRRVVQPMQDVLTDVQRRELHLVPEAMAPYFRDVHDHAIRVAERTDSLREVVTSMLGTRSTQQNNRLNEIMKKLTAWAAIIAVPTAVTGWFGQNVPYPGFSHTSGLIASGVLIGVVAVVLYVGFRRKDWL